MPLQTDMLISFWGIQVDHNDKTSAALLKFNELWQTKMALDSILIFSTGRSHKLFEELKVSSMGSSEAAT